MIDGFHKEFRFHLHDHAFSAAGVPTRKFGNAQIDEFKPMYAIAVCSNSHTPLWALTIKRVIGFSNIYLNYGIVTTLYIIQ